MLIYRIEGVDGCGPFAGRENITDLHWDTFLSVNNKPLPKNDGFKRLDIHNQEEIVCGCSTLEQLREWFPYETVQLLDDDDYCLAEYEVKDPKYFEIGGNQVLFSKEHAVCTERVPVYEMYCEII